MGSDPDFTFGPAGDQWLYRRADRTYDLTREGAGDGSGGRRTYTVATSRGPADTRIALDPAVTALVVVDMQNFFLHPTCRDHPTGLAAVKPTLDVVEKCRSLGVQVVWLNWGLTDADLAAMPAAISRSFSASLIDAPPPPDQAAGSAAPAQRPPWPGLGADMGEGRGRCLVAGTWNAELYGPLAAAVREGDGEGAGCGDAHCAKNRMSGMWNPEQPLWRYLEGRKIRTLLFAGVNTDQCVLGTLVDAYNARWDCIMIEDCCATPTPSGHEVCLYNVAKCYGFVVNSRGFIEGQVNGGRSSDGGQG